MSLYDKMMCANEECKHPRYEHTGSHIKRHRTMCLRQVGEHHTDKCKCMAFVEPKLIRQDAGE